MGTWRPKGSEVINPVFPLGTSMGDTAPFADVPVATWQEGNGGFKESQHTEMLKHTLAAQCRVLRLYERTLRGSSGVQERLKAYNVGYSEPVFRRSLQSVKFLTGGRHEQFDERINRDFMEIADSNDQMRAVAAQASLTRLLSATLRDAQAAKLSGFIFKRNNFDPRKKPGHDHITAAFNPPVAKSDNDHLLSDLLQIATYGLVNASEIYTSFYYLRRPLRLAVFIGTIAVYKAPRHEGVDRGAKELRQSLRDIVLPDEISRSEPHIRNFLNVRSAVLVDWEKMEFDSILAGK